MLEGFDDFNTHHLPERAILRWDLEDDWKFLDNALQTTMPLMLRANVRTSAEFFQGKSILTLGCGSPQSTKQETRGDYVGLFEAWVPRLAWGYGATTNIGIDYYSQDPFDLDVYDHVQADFVAHAHAGTLADLFAPEVRFDIVFAREVFEWDSYEEIHQLPSPTLARSIFGHYPLTDREKAAITPEIHRIRNLILEQLQPRMNEGCLVRIDWPVYRYTAGKLVYLD